MLRTFILSTFVPAGTSTTNEFVDELITVAETEPKWIILLVGVLLKPEPVSVMLDPATAIFGVKSETMGA